MKCSICDREISMWSTAYQLEGQAVCKECWSLPSQEREAKAKRKKPDSDDAIESTQTVAIPGKSSFSGAVNGMDYKKLGLAILGLGAVLLLVGGVLYVANLPTSMSNGSLQEYLRVNDENIMRSIRRGTAVKFLIGGGITAFLGGALWYSAKEDVAGPVEGMSEEPPE